MHYFMLKLESGLLTLSFTTPFIWYECNSFATFRHINVTISYFTIHLFTVTLVWTYILANVIFDLYVWPHLFARDALSSDLHLYQVLIKSANQIWSKFPKTTTLVWPNLTVTFVYTYWGIKMILSRDDLSFKNLSTNYTVTTRSSQIRTHWRTHEHRTKMWRFTSSGFHTKIWRLCYVYSDTAIWKG